MSIYSWQKKNWTYVANLYKNKKLPHAILLWGQKGLGLHHFAEQFSAWLLCDNAKNSQYACQKCTSCQWLAAGTHPDRLIVSPELNTTSIKVDAIREIRAFSEQKSHGQGGRIILISPAESMNVSAANALLKILEEPFEDTIFILVSYHLSWILPTIVSRCQKIYFSPLNEEEYKAFVLSEGFSDSALQLFALSGGAPLAFETPARQQETMLAHQKIASLLEAMVSMKLNPVEAAEQIKTLEKEAHMNFELLIDILFHCVYQRISFSWQKESVNKEKTEHFLRTSEVYSLYKFYDKLLIIKHHLKTGININQAIWLEDLFFTFGEVYAR